MLFIGVEDFYQKAESCRRLTRAEEIQCAKQMLNGDADARRRLMESYMPVVAGHIKRMKPHMQNLAHTLYCLQALEKAADSFDFLHSRETFAHRLSWWLRQATTRYIARR